MSPRLTKLLLTTHIALSVGWLGGVAGFLVLSIVSLTSRNPEIVRGSYLSMNALGLYALVPLSFGALITGLFQSLGTTWGLFRQYWTSVKFGLTVGAVLLLLMHQFGAISGIAQRVLSSPTGALPDVRAMEIGLAIKAGLAVLVLLVTTTLSVYKPWGFTQYGRRIQLKRSERQGDGGSRDQTLPSAAGEAANHHLPFGLKIFLAVIVLLVLIIGISGHLGGHGSHDHLHGHSDGHHF